MKLLVTGGMGFIGSNFIRRFLADHQDAGVINLDKLSYGSNPANLKDLENDKRYQFSRGDINDSALVKELAENVEAVVNFAAETHVDRSIANPRSFHETNTAGVLNLLEACREHDLTLMQVSTDEIYGSAEPEHAFAELDRLDPSSPYSASKGAADLFVNAYQKTYGLRTLVTRSTNNFGPYQFPEKFIPKIVVRASLGLSIPIYGSGRQVRDWIYVEDHCEAIDMVLQRGRHGETYNISGGNQVENIQVAAMILEILDKPTSLVQKVEDRPAHDFRYSLDASKIKREVGWNPRHKFEDALERTVAWYLKNESWWRPLVNEKTLSPTPWKEKW